MGNKNFLKQLKFCQELTDIFNIYSSCLDDYFKDIHNQKEHLELYNYYVNLKNNILNSAKKHGVIN